MDESEPEDQLIEIGDIEDDLSPERELAPQVVIEYRDRGIPWMLVPPLLALVAVIAGVCAYNYTNKWKTQRPPAIAIAEATPRSAVDYEPLPEPVPGYPTAAGRFDGPPPPAPELRVIENPAAPQPPPTTPRSEHAAPVSQVAATTNLGATQPDVAAPAETLPEAAPHSVPLFFDPRGFDTPALVVGGASGAAPVDQNLAPVTQTGQPDELPVAANNNVDQPEMIDDDLLPPDPRKARFDRKRREHEARIRAEQERFEFYANLYAIYKKHSPNAAAQIQELCKAYGQDVLPAARDQAVKLLGKTGAYAGASPAGRISLLRKLGFPESAILGDIFDMESRHESFGARDAPSRETIYLRSVRTLLTYPPGRPGGTSRSVPTPRSNARVQSGTDDPAASLTPDLDQ